MENKNSRYTYAMLLIRVKLSTPPLTEHEEPHSCDQHFSLSTLACLSRVSSTGGGGEKLLPKEIDFIITS